MSKQRMFSFAGFYYYGRKKRLVRQYPPPKHDIIVEPFAGAAAYACHYPHKQVILVDLNENIVTLWKYLIAATKEDIQKLPILESTDHLNDKKFDYLVPGAKLLIGFHLGISSHPHNKPMLFCKWKESTRKAIAESIHLINHWQVFHCSYEDMQIPEGDATWFVDPPYSTHGGDSYKHGSKNILFDQLRDWVCARQGQKIVCDKAHATWLPFRELRVAVSINNDSNCHRRRNVEGVCVIDDSDAFHLCEKK